ncbi:MAG: hypothetical protein LC130_23315 [Bryobacterales bacterium]|nr:hypothetical protein [Bryobacterales bacterium]
MTTSMQVKYILAFQHSTNGGNVANLAIMVTFGIHHWSNVMYRLTKTKRLQTMFTLMGMNNLHWAYRMLVFYVFGNDNRIAPSLVARATHFVFTEGVLTNAPGDR